MSVKVSSSSKPTFSSHVYNKAGDVAGAFQEVNGKLPGVQDNLQKARMVSGLEAKPNDGGVGNASQGFNLWKAVGKVALGVGLAMASGPAAAVVGAALAVSDGVGAMTQKPHALAEYDGQTSFGPISKNSKMTKAEEDALAQYTDATGEKFQNGYAVAQFTPQQVAQNIMPSPLGFGHHDENDHREKKESAQIVATLEKQEQALLTQSEFASVGKKDLGMGGINNSVARGWTPPPPSMGMMG